MTNGPFVEIDWERRWDPSAGQRLADLLFEPHLTEERQQDRDDPEPASKQERVPK